MNPEPEDSELTPKQLALRILEDWECNEEWIIHEWCGDEMGDEIKKLRAISRDREQLINDWPD